MLTMMHQLFQELSNDLGFCTRPEIGDDSCHPRLIWSRGVFHIVTFPGFFFLRYSSYYWFANFYYGSFRQFVIISDLIFIIAVISDIFCEYVVLLFLFCFDLLIIDCGTHCNTISNIITAFISAFQGCTVVLHCDTVVFRLYVTFFRVVLDSCNADWILTFPIVLL